MVELELQPRQAGFRTHALIQEYPSQTNGPDKEKKVIR